MILPLPAHTGNVCVDQFSGPQALPTGRAGLLDRIVGRGAAATFRERLRLEKEADNRRLAAIVAANERCGIWTYGTPVGDITVRVLEIVKLRQAGRAAHG